VVRNMKRIMASIKMLEINISDVSRILKTTKAEDRSSVK